jgi:hypothetical protein
MEQSGISRSAAAKVLLERLRQTEVGPDSSDADFVRHNFLERGSGRVKQTSSGTYVFDNGDQETLWSILNDDQFVEALRICVAKEPLSFLQDSSQPSLVKKLRARLSDDQLRAVVGQAVSLLPSLDGVTAEAFDVMPLPWQELKLTEHNGGTASLLIHVALKLGYTDRGKKLCTDFAHVFKKWPVDHYCELWNRKDEVDDLKMAEHLLNLLLTFAQDKGFFLGTVTLERRKGRTHAVVYRRLKYVQPPDDRLFFPEGYQVFVQRHGRKLSAHCIECRFVPVGPPP